MVAIGNIERAAGGVFVDNVAHRGHVGVLLLTLQCMRWQSMCGPRCCSAHGGCSRCKAVDMKDGDGDGDGGGKEGVCVRLWVVFVFDYELCLCLLMSSSKDRLDQSFVSLEISKIVRDWRLDCGCSLWQSWEFPVLGSHLGTGLPSTSCRLHAHAKFFFSSICHHCLLNTLATFKNILSLAYMDSFEVWINVCFSRDVL